MEFIEILDKQADIDTLRDMYENIFYPAFPNDDERESLENLAQYIQEGYELENRHIVCLKAANALVGCMILTYFHEADIGYISYVAIDSKHRRKGYATAMLKEGMRMLTQDAKMIGKSLKYIFGEISNDNPQSAHMLDRAGFKILDLDYIQPPLGENKNASDELNLVVLSNDHEGIPANDVKLFIKVFFQRALSIPQHIKNKYINEMTERIGADAYIRLLNIIPD